MYTDGTVNDLIIDIIINEVEERPFLYNKTCEDYSKLNAQQKKEAFFNIALRIEECVGVQISGIHAIFYTFLLIIISIMYRLKYLL